MGFAKSGIVGDAFLPKMIEQCSDDQERGMVYILYYTGMHGSVLRNLSLDNLKVEGESTYLRWTRTKTNKRMEAPLPQNRLPIIRQFLIGKKPGFRWMNILLKDIGERAGYEGVSTMTFRHTRTLRLIQEGVPLPMIAEVMGCTGDVITRNYAKLTETQKRNEVSR